MISRRQWLFFIAGALLTTGCVGILDPNNDRTGIIEQVQNAEGGNVLLRDVRGDQYKSLFLAIPEDLEILVEGPGGQFEVGPRSALQPGVRIRFERTDGLTLLITPPGFWATKIWVLQD